MKKIILFLMFLLAVPVLANAANYKDANNAGYIFTPTTTTLKTGVGTLHTITVGGGIAGTIVAYDNTTATGTPIVDFDSTNALETYKFDIVFTTGLTFVTSNFTKVMVSYK